MNIDSLLAYSFSFRQENIQHESIIRWNIFQQLLSDICIWAAHWTSVRHHTSSIFLFQSYFMISLITLLQHSIIKFNYMQQSKCVGMLKSECIDWSHHIISPLIIHILFLGFSFRFFRFFFHFIIVVFSR